MDPKAVSHAQKRLDKARHALVALEASTSLHQAEIAWSDFISAASTIYSKLEQGAKTNGKSAAWFGRKKKERKDDQLLSYIHHARNSDEHSITDITHQEPGSWGIGGEGHYVINGWTGPGGKIDVTHLSGPPPFFYSADPAIRLVPVTDDRYGDRFDPPSTHLGKDLSDQKPFTVASLAFDYLLDLVADAQNLSRPS